MIPLSLGSSSSFPYFKVSFNAGTGNATIKYGVLNVNSKFVSSNPKIGESTVIAAPFSSYIYMRIDGMFNRADQPVISFFSAFESPDGGITPDGAPTEIIDIDAAPFPNTICLAFIDGDGKVFDLRPAWIINVFSFLG